MLEGKSYSLEEFFNDTSYDELCEHFIMDEGIGRGVPTDKRCHEYAAAMRLLLVERSIDPQSSTAASMEHVFLDAYRNGYIEMNEADRYAFTSPLHQQLWSWRLLPQTDYEIPFQDLFSFVKAAIFRFRPIQLGQSDRRVGSDSHDAPEAQYQDECYRCVHDLTKGNVRISPEYAAASKSRPGRIDFFIPKKKWGIELTRNGSKLKEHDSRFAIDGAYGQWLQSMHMVDYVLLDFRSTMPVQRHPGEIMADILLG